MVTQRRGVQRKLRSVSRTRSMRTDVEVNMDEQTIFRVLLEEEEDDDIIIQMLKQKRRKRRHDIFSKRETEGCFNMLIQKHLYTNDVKFKEYFRISKDQFMTVLDLIENQLTTASCNRYKKPISAAEKLSLTLRFLATGESMRSLAFQFRISHNYISGVIKETLKALCKYLTPIYLPSVTEDILKNSADKFMSTWNFPCCGAIDGKHCRIRCPPKTGSLYYNYKKFFSIVLLAIVDPDCKFICVDIGSYGKEGDNGIFSKSIMGRQIENGTFPFPADKQLPGTEIFLPQFLVGDGGFKLLPRLMKPYSTSQGAADIEKRQFNYRLSRARRTVESAFGELANVFRVFHTPIQIAPETIDYLIMAACCLHNMLITEKQKNSTTHNDALNNAQQQMPTRNLLPIRRSGGSEMISAVNIRNELKNYICSPTGRVAWQSSFS